MTTHLPGELFYLPRIKALPDCKASKKLAFEMGQWEDSMGGKGSQQTQKHCHPPHSLIIIHWMDIYFDLLMQNVLTHNEKETKNLRDCKGGGGFVVGFFGFIVDDDVDDVDDGGWLVTVVVCGIESAKYFY